MRKFLLSVVTIVTLLLTTISETKASHLLGGEITWECSPTTGKLQFTVKLYRYCDGSGFLTVPNIQNPLYATYGGPSSIPTSLQSTIDISPECYDSNLEMDCYGTNSSNSIEERIYKSAWVQINGTPSVTGSIFYYSTCCRPGTTVMRNINGSNYWLRAVMYPYTPPNSTTPLSYGSSTGGPTCYDSSPEFGEKPATIICMGYNFTYNHNATDRELDSLVYKWALPMQTATNGITWKPGFSTNLQLPNTNHNVNNTNPSLDPNTGEVSFKILNSPTNPTEGQYTTVVKVEEWRCNQKIGEIFRDIPVVLLNCPLIPMIPTPIPNTPPQVVFRECVNCNPPYVTPASVTVWAGDRVKFHITSIDIQFLPGLVPQKNYLYPQGTQFGNTFSDTVNGCPYPPCATLDHNSYYNSVENRWEGDYGIATSFEWRTDCSHISAASSCFVTTNTYNFVFKVLDNWCPAPGMNFQTFTVKVVAPPALEAPLLKCVDILPNGTVNLSWDQPVTLIDDTLSSFRYYRVYRTDLNEDYFLLDSIDDIDILVYSDLTAYANDTIRKYFIQGVSSCNNQGLSILSDTLSTMMINVTTLNDSTQNLVWNPFEINNDFPSSTTRKYYIYEIFNNVTTLIDSTVDTNYTLEQRVCYPSFIEYQITVVDTTLNLGCTSHSTIDGSTLGFKMSPPNLRCVSYLDNETIRLTWIPPVKKDPMSIFGSYRIYHSTTGSSFQWIGTVTGLVLGDEIGWDTLGWTHNSVNPSIDNYYYVVTLSGCDGEQIGLPSRTMKAIRLNITDVSDDEKNLTWNPTIIPEITNNPYGIWSDFGGNYTGIGTQPNGNEFWFETLYLCNQTVNFYVSQQDELISCISNSNTDSALYRDITPPVKQFIDSVSINNDSTLVIGWTVNSSPDVSKYMIYDCNKNKIIDSVFSPPFNYNVGQVSGINSYTVYPIDSCGNFLEDVDCEQNMELGLILDYCDGEVDLNWNHYDFKDVEYKIFVSENNGGFNEVDKITKNSYTYKVDESNYCFYIQAWEDISGHSSTSYIGCIDPDAINFPDFAYLSYVTVEDTSRIRMEMEIDLTGDIGEYFVKRSIDNDDYRTIATIPIPDPLTPVDSTFYYEDNNVNTNQHDYFYKIDVINPCGDIGITSNLGRSILLGVRNDDVRSYNFLYWNEYVDWQGDVISYKVYRGSDYNNMTLVRTLYTKDFNQVDGMTFDGDYYYFVDDVSNETRSNGNFCYQIIAVEGTGTFQNNEPAVSKSNVSCVIHNSIIHIPNSFTPNGDDKNEIFKPSISFSGFEFYSMVIFNRWGEHLFTSNDYNTGWNGQDISNGVYIYVIEFIGSDGQSYEYRGTISLLR